MLEQNVGSRIYICLIMILKIEQHLYLSQMISFIQIAYCFKISKCTYFNTS